MKIKDYLIFTLSKPSKLKMAQVENDLDIYYAIGNANTQRQATEIQALLKKSGIIKYILLRN